MSASLWNMQRGVTWWCTFTPTCSTSPERCFTPPASFSAFNTSTITRSSTETSNSTICCSTPKATWKSPILAYARKAWATATGPAHFAELPSSSLPRYSRRPLTPAPSTGGGWVSSSSRCLLEKWVKSIRSLLPIFHTNFPFQHSFFHFKYSKWKHLTIEVNLSFLSEVLFIKLKHLVSNRISLHIYKEKNQIVLSENFLNFYNLFMPKIFLEWIFNIAESLFFGCGKDKLLLSI